VQHGLHCCNECWRANGGQTWVLFGDICALSQYGEWGALEYFRASGGDDSDPCIVPAAKRPGMTSPSGYYISVLEASMGSLLFAG